MTASSGFPSEGYGHDGPGVCLGDGQTEAQGVPSQGGCGHALLRRMPPVTPDLTYTVLIATKDCLGILALLPYMGSERRFAFISSVLLYQQQLTRHIA